MNGEAPALGPGVVHQKIGFQLIDTRLNYIADREADDTPQGALA
jgi:hypothetical protein